MKILIVGAGIVGYNLALELSKEGHDISIIDEDREKIKRISEKLDVLSVEGNACLPSVLARAGIRTAEMAIAVADRDEINLLVCMLAHKFNVKKRFCRLRNMEFTGAGQIFPPSELFVGQAINPGQIIVEFILKILKTPGAVNVAEFADGEILLRGFDVPENAPLAGKKIGELRSVSEFNSFLIVALARDGKLIIPKAQDEIRIGDKAYMLVDKEFLPLVLPMFNKKAQEVEKIVIFGGNRVSVNLARSLEAAGIPDVSIIEPDLEKANEAAREVSRTVVLRGNGTDPDLFDEINMKKADFFMALSDDDESNILSSLLAKKHGARRALAITNDPDYLPILDSIGMDISINPRLITVGAILRHLRKGQVRSVYRLAENDAEVLEIAVNPDSSIAKKKISKLNMPENAIIGAILRNREMIVPDGETVINQGDLVVVVSLPDAIDKIEKLFGKRRFF
ncbi:MAG: Trk system potassium transporter TrkA [Nitrospinae bacterium]|nr:Trk system potassium transporter TrkA [Nitrospinota bacterium]